MVIQLSADHKKYNIRDSLILILETELGYIVRACNFSREVREICHNSLCGPLF